MVVVLFNEVDQQKPQLIYKSKGGETRLSVSVIKEVDLLGASRSGWDGWLLGRCRLVLDKSSALFMLVFDGYCLLPSEIHLQCKILALLGRIQPVW